MFLEDRVMFACKQAVEKHGRLWMSLLRCGQCGMVQMAAVPAKWGFKSARCVGCTKIGACTEIPDHEFNSQRAVEAQREKLKLIV